MSDVLQKNTMRIIKVLLGIMLVCMLLPVNGLNFAGKALADFSIAEAAEGDAQTNAATTTATGYSDQSAYTSGTAGESKVTQTASWTNKDSDGNVQAYDTANLNVTFDTNADTSATEDPQYYIFALDVSDSMTNLGAVNFSKSVMKSIAEKANALNSNSQFGFVCFSVGYENYSLSGGSFYHSYSDFGTVVDTKAKRNTSEGGTQYAGIMSLLKSCTTKYTPSGSAAHLIWITDGTIPSSGNKTGAYITSQAISNGLNTSYTDISVIQTMNGSELSTWSKGLINYGDTGANAWGSYQVVESTSQLNTVASAMTKHGSGASTIDSATLTVNIDPNFAIDTTKDISMPGFTSAVSTTADGKQVVTFTPNSDTVIYPGTSYAADIPLICKQTAAGTYDVTTSSSSTLSYTYASASKAATPAKVQLDIPKGNSLKYDFNGGQGIAEITETTPATGTNVVVKSGDGLANSTGGAFGGWLMSYTDSSGSSVEKVVKGGSTFVMPNAEVTLTALYNSTDLEKDASAGSEDTYILSGAESETATSGILTNVEVSEGKTITPANVTAISFTKNSAPTTYAYRTNIADDSSTCPIYAYVINDSGASTYAIQVDAAGTIKATANSLVSLFGGNFNPSTDAHSGFLNCKSVTIDNLDCTDATSAYQMFCNCGYNLRGTTSSTAITINVSGGLATSSVTNMDRMFAFTGSASMDFSTDALKIDTSNAESMVSFARGNTNSKSIKVSPLDTSKCKDMSYFFQGNSSFTTMTMGGDKFTTAACTNMTYMFSGCSSIAGFNMSAFDTANVTTMYGMFYNCSAATYITFPSNFVTSNCTSIGYMFYGCTKLETLDVSGFTVGSNITGSIGCVFYNCESLTTIYASSGTDWGSNTTITGQNLFYGCTSLKAKSGTYTCSFSSSYTSKTWARVYTGGTVTESNRGYFTKKTATNETNSTLNSVEEEVSDSSLEQSADSQAEINSVEEEAAANLEEEATVEAEEEAAGTSEEKSQTSMLSVIGQSLASGASSLFSGIFSTGTSASADEENSTGIVDKGSVSSGSTITYKLKVKNTGDYGSVSNDITVTDTLPSGVTYDTSKTPTTSISWTDTSATPPSYATKSGYADNISCTGNVLTFNVHNLAGKATLELDFVVKVTDVATTGVMYYINSASWKSNAVAGTTQTGATEYYPTTSGVSNSVRHYSGQQTGTAYTVTYVNAADSPAGVPAAPSACTYNDGSTVSLPTIAAGDTYKAPTFSSGDVTIGSDNTFTMPAKNVTITINYEAITPTTPTTYNVEYAARGWDTKTAEEASLDCPAYPPNVESTTVVKGANIGIPTGLTTNYYNYLYDTTKDAESDTPEATAFANSVLVQLYDGSTLVGSYTPTTDELNAGSFATPTSTSEYTKIKVILSWERKSYTVKYQYSTTAPDKDHQPPESMTVKWNDDFAPQNAQTCTGYTFEGWFSDKVLKIQTKNSSNSLNATSSVLTADSNSDFEYVMPTQDVTFTGTWEKLPDTYYVEVSGGTVSVEGATAVQKAEDVAVGNNVVVIPADKTASGQECSSISVKYSDDSTATVPFDAETNTPTKNSDGNWVFTMPSMTDASGTAHTGGIIVTCNYTAIKSGVTFDANGGSWTGGATTQNISQTYGQPYAFPASNPARTGYTFDGWYTADTGGTKVTSTTTVTQISDSTIYAHWTIQSHTLTINYQYSDKTKAADSVTGTYNYGVAYSVASPSISGYTADKTTVSGTMGEADVEVTVTYSINKYTLTINYKYTDGTVAQTATTKQIEYNGTYSEEAPTITDAELADSSKGTISGTMDSTSGKEITFEYVRTTMTVTPTAYNGTYDGNDHSISLKITGGPTSGATTYYSTDNTNWQTDVINYKNFTNGAKTIYVKVEATGYKTATANSTVTISKATAKLTVSGSKTYDGSVLSKDVDEDNWSGLAGGETITGSVSTTNNGDAGTYTKDSSTAALSTSFTKTNIDDNNYTYDYSGASLTIEKGTLSISATADQDYNGKAFSVNSTDNSDKVSITGLASTDSAKVTLTTKGTDADTYNTLDGTSKGFSSSLTFTTGKASNYNDLTADSYSVALTINKATLTANVTKSVAYNSGNKVQVTVTTTDGITGGVSGELVTCVFETSAGDAGTYGGSDTSKTVSKNVTYADDVKSANYTENFSAVITILEDSVTTRNVTFAATPTGYGSVSSASATVVDGCTYAITADTSTGTSTITIKNGSSTVATCVATPATDSVETYTFEKWKIGDSEASTTGTISADTAFTAVFKMEDRESLKIEKTCNIAADKSVKIGDTITYTITVTNDGNKAISDIKVVDTLLGYTEAKPYTISSLAVNATETITGTYTISSKDFASSATSITNSATVKWGTSSTDTDSVTTTLEKTKIDKPSAKTGLTYTGVEQTGVEGGTGYTLTGEKGTEAGSHTAAATLDDGYIWSDNDTTDYDITWQIAKAEVTVTATAETTYNKSAFETSLTDAKTCSITGLQNGETADKSSSKFKTAGANADTYTYGATDTAKGVSGALKLSGSASTDNYDITYNVTLKINAKKLTKDMVTATGDDVTYNGEDQSPDIAVKDGDTTLVESTDYSTSGDVTKQDASTSYKITVTGTGNYTGTVDVGWKINKRKVTLAPVDATHTYNGEEQTLNVVDVAQPTTLVKGHQVSEISFTASRKNAGTTTGVKIDTSKVVVKNASLQDVTKNYDLSSGTASLTISKLGLSIAIVGNTAELPYNGETQTLSGYTLALATESEAYSAFYDSKKVEGPAQTDFKANGKDVTYTTEGQVTAYDLTIDKTKFSYNDDNIDASFYPYDGWLKITPLSLENAQIELGDIVRSNDSGVAQTQTISRVSVGSVLATSDEYSVSNNYGTDPGKYTLTVTAKDRGNFINSKDADWTILGDSEEDIKKIGNIDFEFKVGENAPASELHETKSDMIDTSSTANDLATVSQGNTLLITLEVNDATETITAPSKALLDAQMNANGQTLGQYLDISLFKKLNNNEAEAVTETKNPVEISLTIPASMRAAEGVDRTFYLVRNHGGAAEYLTTTYDEEAQTLTFSSDKFSDYALAYKDGTEPKPDPKPDPSPTPTPTPDNGSEAVSASTSSSSGAQTSDIAIAALGLGIAAALISFAALSLSRKRHSSK